MLVPKIIPKCNFLKNCVIRGKTHRRTLVVDITKRWEGKGAQVHLLDEKPSEFTELNKELGLELYKTMHLIRIVEEESASLYQQKRIRGFCHLYVGEEAVATGMTSVLTPDDTIITAYRCHGWYITRCDDVLGLIAELLGNSTGASRGKGGSMHVYGDNFFGGNGIVGAHVPLGVGIGLKHKYTGSKNISVTVFGDGAFPNGQVHESFNFAKLHNLPVMFVVENNMYGMGTSTARSYANSNYYNAIPYIPGLKVNGMDVLSVIEATKFAIKYIRDGKGPIVLEMVTYRYLGHSMSDPGTSYRDRSEIQQVRKERDCIKTLETVLLQGNLATAEELKAVKDSNKKRVHRDIETAKNSKFVPLEDLTADVYKTYTGQIRVPQFFADVSHKNLPEQENKCSGNVVSPQHEYHGSSISSPGP